MGLGCGALLVWIAVAPPNWLADALSFRTLRAVGIVGYSFYLWHKLPLLLLPQWTPVLRFPVALIITFLISCVTYILVERPAIRLGAWLSSRIPDRRPAAGLPGGRVN